MNLETTTKKREISHTQHEGTKKMKAPKIQHLTCRVYHFSLSNSWESLVPVENVGAKGVCV